MQMVSYIIEAGTMSLCMKADASSIMHMAATKGVAVRTAPASGEVSEQGLPTGRKAGLTRGKPCRGQAEQGAKHKRPERGM